MHSETASDGSSADQFMLKEYERIHQLWVDENNQAERRVSFFLTLAPATAGVLLLVYKQGGIDSALLVPWLIGALAVLLLFGLTILSRLNARLAQTEAFRASMGEIQDYFGERYATIEDYVVRQRRTYRPNEGETGLSRFLKRFLYGSLTDLMILCNAFLVGGAVLLALSRLELGIGALVWLTSAAVVVAWVLIYVSSLAIRARLSPWSYF